MLSGLLWDFPNGSSSLFLSKFQLLYLAIWFSFIIKEFLLLLSWSSNGLFRIKDYGITSTRDTETRTYARVDGVGKIITWSGVLTRSKLELSRFCSVQTFNTFVSSFEVEIPFTNPVHSFSSRKFLPSIEIGGGTFLFQVVPLCHSAVWL